MAKRIVMLEGHPAPVSLSKGLAEAYARGAEKAGHELRWHRLSQMRFDPDLGVSHFRDAPPLEPDLQAFWDDLLWCEHLVIVHPMWWGGWPAKLKGLIDRTFLHGKAFQYRKTNPFPQALLSGRTSRILMTSDTPAFALRFLYGFGLKAQVKRQILDFCGLKLRGLSGFSPVRGSSEARRAKWLKQAEDMGHRGA